MNKVDAFDVFFFFLIFCSLDIAFKVKTFLSCVYCAFYSRILLDLAIMDPTSCQRSFSDNLVSLQEKIESVNCFTIIAMCI